MTTAEIKKELQEWIEIAEYSNDPFLAGTYHEGFNNGMKRLAEILLETIERSEKK